MSIDEIKARAEAATPGPWFPGADMRKTAFDILAEKKSIASVPNIYNATFIAHAREDIPALLAEIERLNAELTDYHHSQKIIDGQLKQLERLRRICDNLTARAEKAEATLAKAVEMLPHNCETCSTKPKNCRVDDPEPYMHHKKKDCPAWCLRKTERGENDANG